MKQPRPELLGRFEIDASVQNSIEQTGLLELVFDRSQTAAADASLLSLDGNKSLLGLTPSGAIRSLLVQDYVNGEFRSIPFEIGSVELQSDEGTITVTLRQSVTALSLAPRRPKGA